MSSVYLSSVEKVRKCRKENTQARQNNSLVITRSQGPLSPPQLSSVQLLSRVWLFETPWTAAHQASASISNSQSMLKLMPIELVMPSSHLILCCPILLPSIFPSIRVFSKKSVLRITWPKYWRFSFSISPSIEYLGLISLGLTGLIFLQSKGLSRFFSNTTVQKHQFLSPQPLYSPALTSIHDYWKNHNLD